MTTVYRLPFRLLGIPVHLDLTFLLVLPLLAWLIGSQIGQFARAFSLNIDTSSLTLGPRPYLLGLICALGLFASILIHELGHSLVGQRFNLKIRSITLWVLGGMAQFESIPRKKGTEAIMALAGPATSGILAVFAWIALNVTPPGLAAVKLFSGYLFYMNALLALFNLLPALPLDGGRILRSLLALRLPFSKATKIAATTSKLLALLIGFAGAMFMNLWMILIAFFIFVAVTGESQQVASSTLATTLRGIRVEDLMTKEVRTVTDQMTVSELMNRMLVQHHLAFPVFDSQGLLVGIVSLQDIRRAKQSGNPIGEATVSEIMSCDPSSIGQTDTAFEAFQRIGRSSSGRLIVVDASGKLTGIISKSDLLRALEIKMLDFNRDDLDA